MHCKIRKHEFYYFGILILMFVGSTNVICSYISIVVIALLAIELGKFYSEKTNVDCCVGIVLLLVFQNFSIGLGAHILNNYSASLMLMTQMPFMTIVIIWGMCFIGKRRLIAIDGKRKKFFVLCMLILLSLAFGHGSINAILINIRNMTVFFLAYEIGFAQIDNKKDLEKFERTISIFAFVLLISGLILLVGGYPLYKMIGINEVYFAKGSSLSGDLDGRFHTTLIKTQYLRMGSLFYEPINLGYFYACAFLTAWFGNWQKTKLEKFLSIAISGLGLILTFGKGGYLIAGTVWICVYVYRRLNKVKFEFSREQKRSLIIIAMILGVTSFCIFYVNNIGAAVLPHFWGIIQTLESVKRKPIGYGLGTGGNMSQTLNGLALSFETGSETALMSYFYQIGIQGGIAFVICVINLALKPDKQVAKEIEMFCFVPYILVIMSLLQDNTFTPQCIVLFMICQGAANRIQSNYLRK